MSVLLSLFNDFYFQTAVKLFMGFWALIIQMKLSGKTQLAPISVVDQLQNYVLGGIIGGVIYSTSITILQFFIVLLIWTLIVFVTKYLMNRSHTIKKWVDGSPTLIIKNGTVLVKNLLDLGMSASDLSYRLRMSEATDFRHIKEAVIEQNGQINLTLEGEKTTKYPVITDGHINEDALESVDQDEKWVTSVLEKKHLTVSDIYLAFCVNGELIYTAYEDKSGK